MPVCPSRARQRQRGAARRALVPACRHRNRQPAFGNIREHETAHHRHIRDRPLPRRSHTGLRLRDQVGIRTLPCAQRHRRRRQRQPDVRGGRLHPAEHLVQQVGRLRRALALVHMRIGAIADQRVQRLHRARRHIRVQVMRGDDRHVRAHHPPQHLHQYRFRIVLAFGAGRPVVRHIDRVHRQRRLQARAHLVQEFPPYVRARRTAGWGAHHDQRHRLPRAARIHALVEPRQFAGQMAYLARQLGNALALFPALRAEIRLHGQRREGVRFEMEAQDGNPWIIDGHRGSSFTPCARCRTAAVAAGSPSIPSRWR
ncbi:hypothetical protein BOFL111202_25710 [Bordetella flabilis]